MLDVVERLAWMKNSVAWHYHTKHLGGTGVHVPHGSGDGFRGSRRSTVQRVQKCRECRKQCFRFTAGGVYRCRASQKININDHISTRSRKKISDNRIKISF